MLENTKSQLHEDPLKTVSAAQPPTTSHTRPTKLQGSLLRCVRAVYPVSVLHSATGFTKSRHHTWLYRRTVLPILALLRMGATPRTLAWSVALGLLIGINPILGSTTVLCLALSFAFRLNVVASQIANHLVFPLQLILVIPFIRAASRLFGMPAMPLSPHALLLAARTAPLELSRQLWQWESRAFLLWLALTAIAAPIIALTLTPILNHLIVKSQRKAPPQLTS